MSLSTGVVPDTLRVATLLPTLKKSDADFEQFQNFHPISNLKVVSKLVEKAVAIQLTDHVMAHHLDETFQSARALRANLLRHKFQHSRLWSAFFFLLIADSLEKND